MIWWILRPQLGRFACGVLLFAAMSAVWMSLPTIVAEIIDSVTEHRSLEQALPWLAALMACTVVGPILFITGYRILFIAESRSRVRIVEMMADHLERVGTGVRSSVSAGEMVNLSTDDNQKASQLLFQLGFGAFNAFAFGYGVFMLWRIDWFLGLATGLGMLLIGTCIGPILERLHRRQTTYRSQTAAVSGQAADITGGLRILRGIGGESQFERRYREASLRLRDTGYRLGRADSWLRGIEGSLPFALAAAVTWLAARQAVQGNLTIGEVTAVFGYNMLLANFLGFVVGIAKNWIEAMVAAGRLTRFFATRDPLPAGGERTGRGALADPLTGLVVEEGSGLTVVVSAEADAAKEALTRLAYRADSEATWGGEALRELDRSDIRDRVLLLEEDYLFAESLRDTLRADDEAALAALRTASAEDVYSSLGSDLGAGVDDGGRNLSGGQRQRLRLARALAASPEILLAAEATSAVDAPTEARIAAGVAESRRGRTTVVVSSSPLWLAHADRVVWFDGGKVRAVGTVAELAEQPEFRALTSRATPAEESSASPKGAPA